MLKRSSILAKRGGGPVSPRSIQFRSDPERFREIEISDEGRCLPRTRSKLAARGVCALFLLHPSSLSTLRVEAPPYLETSEDYPRNPSLDSSSAPLRDSSSPARLNPDSNRIRSQNRLEPLDKRERFFQLRELLLLRLELARVHAAAQSTHPHGMLQVQHLVVKQIFDRIARA